MPVPTTPAVTASPLVSPMITSPSPTVVDSATPISTAPIATPVIPHIDPVSPTFPATSALTSTPAPPSQEPATSASESPLTARTPISTTTNPQASNVTAIRLQSDPTFVPSPTSTESGTQIPARFPSSAPSARTQEPLMSTNLPSTEVPTVPPQHTTMTWSVSSPSTTPLTPVPNPATIKSSPFPSNGAETQEPSLPLGPSSPPNVSHAFAPQVPGGSLPDRTALIPAPGPSPSVSPAPHNTPLARVATQAGWGGAPFLAISALVIAAWTLCYLCWSRWRKPTSHEVCEEKTVRLLGHGTAEGDATSDVEGAFVHSQTNREQQVDKAASGNGTNSAWVTFDSERESCGDLRLTSDKAMWYATGRNPPSVSTTSKSTEELLNLNTVKSIKNANTVGDGASSAIRSASDLAWATQRRRLQPLMSERSRHEEGSQSIDRGKSMGKALK
ncbi:hypothetical protein PINS_up004200 [Pythium insidiosum]|nr:hypothetical protein PINS_up004200 [Pythium insidiosum]